MSFSSTIAGVRQSIRFKSRDAMLLSLWCLITVLSGIYDLRPLVVTPTNEALRLDEAKATALSPLFLKPDYGKAKVFCAAAEYDPPEFIRQNFEFAKHLQAHLVPKINDVEQVVVAKRDHFDLPYDLLDKKTIIGKWTLNELTRGK